MSLSSFKKTSVIRYGSKRSGKPPGGYWLPQGPFGKSLVTLQSAIDNPGPVGFSLEGPYRNVGYIGKSYAMSSNGTPFRGQFPIGWGGTYGRYPKTEPTFNVSRVNTLGQQWLYVKPSVLSTKGMLEKKYKWIHNGQYPNYWVQPNYSSGTQSDTKSQGLYIHDKTTSNITVTDVNNIAKYVGYVKCTQPNLYGNSTAGFKYNDLARNGPYGKQIHQPEISSIHTLRIQRRCTDPIGPLKPFPWATNGDTCNSTNDIYVVPPAWYIGLTPSEIKNEELYLKINALDEESIRAKGPLLQYATSKEI